MSSGSVSVPALNVRMTDRQKVVFALVASVLVHIVIFFALFILSLLSRDVARTKPLENVKLVEVAVATPTPTPIAFEIKSMEQPVATPTPMISSDDLHKTDQAPKKPVFESDENLAAGSKQPATGNVPLPSQEGKNRDLVAFSTHNYMLGNGEGGAPAPPVMEFAPAPPPQLTRPASTPLPMRVTAPPAATPEPTAMPTPQEQPKTTSSTPVPAPTATREAIYLPTPVPVATVAPTPDLMHPTPVPTAKPAENVAMNTPRPSPPAEPVQPRQPAYIPETEQNRIQGNLSNNDKTRSGRRLGTPTGRYEKKISAAVGGLWYYYCHERRDLITAGTVHIRFYINQKRGSGRTANHIQYF